jgi:hypothetical protein
MNPRNEYQGPERRKSQLSDALTNIIDLQTDVVNLTKAVNHTQETQEQYHKKIMLLTTALIGIGLVLVILVPVLRYTQTSAEAAKKSANTLEDCLIPKGKCFQRLALEGQSNSIRNIKFTVCWQSIPIEDRSKARAITCAKYAYPEIKNIEEQLKDMP